GRRHTRSTRDWSSDVCSSDLARRGGGLGAGRADRRQGAGRPHWLAVLALGSLFALAAHRSASLDGRENQLDSPHPAPSPPCGRYFPASAEELTFVRYDRQATGGARSRSWGATGVGFRLPVVGTWVSTCKD